MNDDFNIAVDSFPWKEEENKKAFLSFVQFQMQFGLEPRFPAADLQVIFFIEKSFEAQEYWRDTFSQQIGSVQDLICDTREQIERALSRINQLEMTVRNQMHSIDALTVGADRHTMKE